MIARTQILSNLRTLDSKYRRTTSARESFFYSKLAILELCGWIEESMDDLIQRCAQRQLKLTANRVHIQKQVVERTYGFDYERNFRRMLIQLLGLIDVERLEKSVDQTKQMRLKATLATLKASRDQEAHTHLRGIARSINAPSVTLGQFPAVYDGLLDYDRVIRDSAIWRRARTP